MPGLPDGLLQPLASLPSLPDGAVAPAFHTAVVEALLSGRRVVLRAPGASGKTLAGWQPWLAARQGAYDFPAHLLHVLPGGVFYEDLVRRLSSRLRDLDGRRVSVQTEGDAFDPFLLSDAVFTTGDALLGMALHRPPGLHPSLSNIDAGELFGAYLFFDEFPALAACEALALWLGLLRRYLPFTPCLFSSSLLPRPLLSRIAASLGAEFIDASGEGGGGRRLWMTHATLGVEGILRQHRSRTIVVCNTVRGAQLLYRAIQRAAGATAGELLLLHQHQLHRHRQPLFDRAQAIFGPGGEGKGLLITTSGIEAGTDFSAETLITDPCTPDRLLARAARCGRFSGETGRVIVARVSEPLPADTYPAPPWPRLVEALADETSHTAAEELAVLDALWETEVPDDTRAASCTLPPDADTDAALERLISGAGPARVFSRVGVTLHRTPESTADPFALERFTLAISSLERGWRQWQAGGADGEWFALIPHWPADDQRGPSWSPVAEARQFSADARLIVLNAEAISYDPVLGLELSPGLPYQCEVVDAQQTSQVPFDQHVERYDEHAARVLQAFEMLAPWSRYVLRHLGRHWRIPSVELEHWLSICVLWHDAGKLTTAWQRAAHRWQEGNMRRPMPGALARLDYQARRDGPFPCPPHAACSARVLARALGVLLANRPALFSGTLAALSHHHGVAGAEVGDMTPEPDGWATLLELAGAVLDDRQLRRLDRVGWTLTLRGQSAIPAMPPADPDAWIAYSLLVRILRLADREVSLEQMLA